MDIKPIDTVYKGYKFRSRLEARWAVFFDALGIAWEYEPEGFELSDGTRYLPDFYLPHINTYIEIKGHKVSKSDYHKIELFSSQNRIILLGTIPMPDIKKGETVWDYYHNNDNHAYGYLYVDGGLIDEYYMFCCCPVCGVVGIEFEGRAERINCNCPNNTHSGKNYNSDDPRILKAYQAARSARFEFGENKEII